MANPLALIFSFISPTLVEHAKYIFGLKDNVKALINAIVELEASSADVVEKVKMQERQGLQQLKNVELWRNRVEDIGSKVCLLLEASDIELQRLSMYGYWSNDFGSTYSHGKMVSEKLKEVEILLSTKPPTDETVARRGLPPRIEMRSTQQPIGLENMLDATWNRLMQENVEILGLYGMGGIGKTTLLEQIEIKLLEKRDEFDVVIFVVVSQDLQIERIQKEIGKRLGLWVSDKQWNQKTKNEKVSLISTVLRGKRFVILLDDLWRKVVLNEIGIPSPSINRSKVVYTTRLRKVCGRMGPDDMEVKCLDSENAWKLFRYKVRATTLESDSNIRKLARIVCEKCKGLPLALNVIGETMAIKSTVREWQHAIDDLNSNATEYPEVKDEILKVLKLSYDYLKDKNVQQCLQYCALFPEDYNIRKDRLVDYWICEGLINGRGPREKAVGRGYEIIGILVSACLLINHETSREYGEGVTMHDVIHQMTLWIASNCGEENENFVVRSGAALHQMPDVENWHAVRRMSLEDTQIQTVSIIPDCPNLTTLLLHKNKLVNISGACFLLMPKLMVLDLSWNKTLVKLPEEVSNLVSLKYLSLAGTALEELPKGLSELIQLRHLDLNNMNRLRSISVIFRLLNLETLKVYNSAPLSLLSIKEIELLKNLKLLSVTIQEISILEKFLSIRRLATCTYELCLRFGEFEAENISLAVTAASLSNLQIRGSSVTYLMENTRYECRSPSTVSFQNLKNVALVEVRGIQDLTWLLFAPSLTILHTMGLPDVREIISRKKASRFTEEGVSIRPFKELRTLGLFDLEEVMSIYWEPLLFPVLTTILIIGCPKLKKLPFNKESSKGNRLRLQSHIKYLEGIEWEDEETKDRFLHECQDAP